MSPLWSQLLSIGGGLLTTWFAAWLKSYFERRRNAPKLPQGTTADDD